jgi:hypothetical protein
VVTTHRCTLSCALLVTAVLLVQRSPAREARSSSAVNSPAQPSARPAQAARPRVSLPTLVSLRWRVDVTISSTSLSRVFKPTVILQMTMSDESVRQCECSVEKFHELRYAVAKSLKHVQDLQRNPLMSE